MSKSRNKREHKRFFDPEDIEYESRFETNKKSDKFQDRRRQKKLKSALKTLDIGSLVDEDF